MPETMHAIDREEKYADAARFHCDPFSYSLGGRCERFTIHDSRFYRYPLRTVVHSAAEIASSSTLISLSSSIQSVQRVRGAGRKGCDNGQERQEQKGTGI